MLSQSMMKDYYQEQECFTPPSRCSCSVLPQELELIEPSTKKKFTGYLLDRNDATYGISDEEGKNIGVVAVRPGYYSSNNKMEVTPYSDEFKDRELLCYVGFQINQIIVWDEYNEHQTSL